ncbi:pectinesterase family protein [Bradyrhizobium sp. DOA9]|uniref:pectinesterase family protein n=1 Tax=Bradyrhizobium sp. DOA9 TaxID=1126627 RepID=UPI00126039E6|nr:pectinesterase family protein [Bradyrhizobium sp. DOA9]
MHKALSVSALFAAIGNVLPVHAEALKVSLSEEGAYRSVQEAVDALPSTGGSILVGPGIYRGKVGVAKPNVYVRGGGKRPDEVVIVYGNSAGTAGGTRLSATLDASGDSFRLENLTVRNDYSANPANPASQAVALSVTGDKVVIANVRILGAQDTLFANKGANGRMSRQFFVDCYIEGHVDFIFGNAKAYFRKCELHGVANHAVVYTAQSRASEDEDSAFVFDHCTLTADSAARNVALGRPWRPYAAVIFLSAQIDAPVMAEGWIEWDPGKSRSLMSAYYAEYRSLGIGADPTGRERYAHQLSGREVKQWSLQSFFSRDTSWISQPR